MTANRSAGVRARDGFIRVITGGNAELSLCTFSPSPVAMRERLSDVACGRAPSDSTAGLIIRDDPTAVGDYIATYIAKRSASPFDSRPLALTSSTA